MTPYFKSSKFKPEALAPDLMVGIMVSFISNLESMKYAQGAGLALYAEQDHR